VPNVVLLGLFGIAAIADGFAGYASGLDAKRNRLPVYTVGFLVSAVILLIFDLDRPSTGVITNDKQSMIDIAASIRALPD
jgi:hydrogenase/urease accessory protein HupE